MEFRPSDLIQLKKDIERMRKHEEKRRAQNSGPPTAPAFDWLHDPALFDAGRRYLADESGVPETGTA